MCWQTAWQRCWLVVTGFVAHSVWMVAWFTVYVHLWIIVNMHESMLNSYYMEYEGSHCTCKYMTTTTQFWTRGQQFYAAPDHSTCSVEHIFSSDKTAVLAKSILWVGFFSSLPSSKGVWRWLNHGCVFPFEEKKGGRGTPLNSPVIYLVQSSQRKPPVLHILSIFPVMSVYFYFTTAMLDLETVLPR